MEKDLFNKISIAYQNLAEVFRSYDRYYSEGYKIYNNDISVVSGERLAFLKQFVDVPFGTFQSQKRKEEFHNQNYMNSACVVLTDTTVNIHQDFELILYYYLVNVFKAEILKFIEVLESKEILDAFNGFIQTEDGKFSFHTARDVQMTDYLNNKVPNYGFVNHLLSRITNELMYLELNGYVTVNLPIIKKILKELENYDFTQFEIK